MVNIRVKGEDGEREIVNMLKPIVARVLQDYGIKDIDNANYYPQRNQNQTAVGGTDIISYGFDIEVKRHEVLSVNTWWRQVTTSAANSGNMPVLLYRQNRLGWSCIMYTYTRGPNNRFMKVRSEVSLEAFLKLYEEYVRHYLKPKDVLVL